MEWRCRASDDGDDEDEDEASEQRMKGKKTLLCTRHGVTVTIRNISAQKRGYAQQYIFIRIRRGGVK